MQHHVASKFSYTCLRLGSHKFTHTDVYTAHINARRGIESVRSQGTQCDKIPRLRSVDQSRKVFPESSAITTNGRSRQAKVVRLGMRLDDAGPRLSRDMVRFVVDDKIRASQFS